MAEEIHNEHVGDTCGSCSAAGTSGKSEVAGDNRYCGDTFFNLSPIPHQSLDKYGRILEVNAAWLAKLGYKLEDVQGHSLGDFLQPKYRSLFNRAFKRFKFDGAVSNREYIFVRKDGSEYPALLNGIVERNTDGTFRSLSCVLEDLHSKPAAGANTAQIHNTLKQISKMARLGTWSYDIESGDVQWSSQMFEICGISDTVSPPKLYEHQKLICEDDWPIFLSDVRQAISTGQAYSHELKIRHPDGSICYVLNQGQCRCDDSGKVMGLFGITQDISDRKAYEQTLHDRDAEIAAMYDSVAIMIALLDGDKCILKANDCMAEFCRQSKSDIKSQRIGNAIKCINACSSPLGCGRSPACGSCGISKALTETYLSGRGYNNRQVTYKGLIEGSEVERNFLVSTNRITIKNEAAVLLSMLDITDSCRAQAERVEMERRLLHSQKLESLGLLAGGIAHDFNNLLMVIMGNIDVAISKLPDASPAAEALDIGRSAAKNAADLTRQMLAYSGRGNFKTTDVDLSELVNEYADLLKTVVPKTITLELDLSTQLHRFTADRGRVQQVVMNLITNAAEAIGQRPGKISLKTSNVDCDQQLLDANRLDANVVAGSYVSLEITDSGCGMDSETIDRLFDPFFTTKITGRGLGMSAVMGIVRTCHGAVLIDSSPYKGTTINVLFPVKADMPAEDIETAAAEGESVVDAPLAFDVSSQCEPSAAAQKGLILIADDDAMVRQLCSTMVKKLGYSVVSAGDGRAALEEFSENRSDIVAVILDMTMPVMSGRLCFEQLRQIDADIPVLMSSGFSELEAMDDLRGRRHLTFIQKPYSYEALRRSLEHLISHSVKK